jgi:hypothetical protein
LVEAKEEAKNNLNHQKAVKEEEMLFDLYY